MADDIPVLSRAQLRGLLATVQHKGATTHERRDAAQRLMRFYGRRLDAGELAHADILLRFVRDAFLRIIDDGESADRAFGLAPERGRPTADNTARDVPIAARVELAKRQEPNRTLEDIYLDISVELGCMSQKRIAQIYAHYGSAVRTASHELLSELANETADFK